MTKPYDFYGWHLSYFAGKTRSYLRYKRVPFKKRSLNLWTLRRTIPKHTGAAVMPVVRDPSGAWLQDTSNITDHIERDFPDRPVVPDTPVQKFASYLLEAWGDEWWIPVAMHTRWNYSENYAAFEKEAGDNLLPGFPKFLKQRIVKQIAALLRGFLPVIGASKDHGPALEAWSLPILDALNAHFEKHPFLMGDTPTIADFSLMGTMYGHLNYDPWPRDNWLALRPALQNWVNRLAAGEDIPLGETVQDDTLPASLQPVIDTIATDFLDLVHQTNDALKSYMAKNPDATSLPRTVGTITHKIGATTSTRGAIPFTLWMLQRALDVKDAMPVQDREKVDIWMQENGLSGFNDLDIPRLRRVNVRVALDKG